MAQQRRYGTRLKSCDRLLPSIESALPLTTANLGMLESDPLRIDAQEPVHMDLRALLEAEKRLKTSNRRPWRPELGNARARIYAQRVINHLRIAENHQIPCPRRCGSVRWELGQTAPCRSSCERNLKSNARRKRRAALNLVHRDMVLRGNGRRSTVPALKYENELLEPMNCQGMKHKPPASTSKTNIEDVFAMEPQVHVLPGPGDPPPARDEWENSPAFKVYEKIWTPTPPPSPSRSVAQNLFSQQLKVLSGVYDHPAREERETSPAFYIRSMSAFGRSPSPSSRLMARNFFSQESGVFTGNDGVLQRQAAEKRRKTSSAPTNCQTKESTPISSPSKTSNMSCNPIIACRSRTNSKLEFSQRSPTVSSDAFQGSSDSSCSESFDEKFTQNSFSLPYSHSSDGESPNLHTGSGPTQIPVHTREETSPAPKIRKELKRVWPESPSVIKANLALKLMQEAKDTWLYAKTLTEFREKSGYYEKRVPMVIIYENSELSAHASSSKKRRENVFASKRKVCPVAADPSQRPATNGKRKSSRFVTSQETQALRIFKRVSKTPELAERERSLPITCQYPNPSAESYQSPNPQRPSSSSNTRADISATDPRELLGDSDPSETFSKNKLLEILRFEDMTPAPKRSPREIEEQISLNNDISGLMAWLERPELSTPSPCHLPLKIQSKEYDETESYVKAILDEEWRTVKGKEIKYYKIRREGDWDDSWVPETNICAEIIRLWKEQKRAAEEERGFAAPKLLPSLNRNAPMASLDPVPSVIGLMNEKSPTPQHSQTLLPTTPETPVMGEKAEPQAMAELSSQNPQLRPTDPARKKRKLTQVSRPSLKSRSTPHLSSIPAREFSRLRQEHEPEAHIKPLPLQSNSSTGHTEPALEAKTQDPQSTHSGLANSGEESPRRQWLSEILDSREWSLLSSLEIAPALPQVIGEKHKHTRSPSPSSISREASATSVKYVSFTERTTLYEPRLPDPSVLKESRRSLPEHLPQVSANSSWPSSTEIPRDHVLLTPTAKLGQKRRASYSPKNVEQIPDKKSRSSKVRMLSPTPPPSSSPAREERELTQESLPEAQMESTPFPRLIFSARRDQTHQIQSISLFGEDIPERWQAVKTPTTQCASETQTGPAPSLSPSSLGNWSAVNQVQTPTSISQPDVESTSIPSFPVPSTPIVVEKETFPTQPPRSEPPPILPGALPRRQVIAQKKASSLDRAIVKPITSHIPVSKIPAVVQKAAAPPLQTRVEPPPILPGALPKRRVIEQKKTASLLQAAKAKPPLIGSVSRIEPAPILPPKRQTVLMKKVTPIS